MEGNQYTQLQMPYQCLSLPGVSQSSYASFPLHKNSVHSTHTHVQISCKCTQWHSLQWRIVVVQLHHRLDAFQRLYSNKTPHSTMPIHFAGFKSLMGQPPQVHKRTSSDSIVSWLKPPGTHLQSKYPNKVY